MSRRRSLLAVVAVSALVSWAVTAGAEEEHVTLDQVPDAVKATILQAAAGAQITEIERETKNGEVTYEAELILNGDEIEIKVAPNGTLLGREVEREGDDEDDLTIGQVPEPARKALLKLAGKAKITGLEREMEHGALIYEAEWVANGTKHEAAVTADGALVEIEEIVPLAQLPAAVRAAIAQHFPAGAGVIVEKKMIVVYEAEAKIDGHEEELLILPTGRVVDDDDDDDDDADDDEDDNDDD